MDILQIKRCVSTNRISYKPAIGELLYEMDTKKLYIGDGGTYGGIPALTDAPYKQPSNPLTNTNPLNVYDQWINTDTGEIFKCLDNTTDANVWIGDYGTGVYDIPIDDFTALDTTNWTLNGAAYHDTTLNCLTLTDAVNSSFGEFIYNKTISPKYFHIEFDQWVGGGSGADYISIQFEWVENGSTKIFGVYAHEYLNKFYMSYDGIGIPYEKSYTGISNSAWTHVKFTIDQFGRCEYWWDNELRLFYNIPKLNNCTFMIRGATGGLNNIHRIDNLQFFYI